jgi:hypothetical protein
MMPAIDPSESSADAAFSESSRESVRMPFVKDRASEGAEMRMIGEKHSDNSDNRDDDKENRNLSILTRNSHSCIFPCRLFEK